MLEPETPGFGAAIMVVTVVALLVLICRCLRSRPGEPLLVVTAIESTATLDATAAPALCTVCLDDMGRGDLVAVLRCSHRFHHDCVLPWLLHHNNCPLCRRAGPALTEV